MRSRERLLSTNRGFAVCGRGSCSFRYVHASKERIFTWLYTEEKGTPNDISSSTSDNRQLHRDRVFCSCGPRGQIGNRRSTPRPSRPFF